ncbi:MAG: carboxypeptidase regulatory-like domain-containing protein [Terriglobales bacterium]
MKQRFVVLVLTGLLAVLSLPAAFAQASGTVKGVCKDVEGKPIAGAQVEWSNLDNGRKYSLKTNNKGEYFSLGITPGKYNVRLTQGTTEIFHFSGVTVGLDETTLDFDLKKEQAAAAQGAGLTPEQLKQQQEQREKALKENNTVKALNDKLSAAKQAADAGDYATAVSTMSDATQMDPTRDLLWAKLGDYTLTAANKQTDATAKTKSYEDAVADYQKAVELKQKVVDTDPKKAPDAPKVLATYFNNMGQAQAKLGKTDDAAKSYQQAAQLDPPDAGQYYFNMGAILTNANVANDAKMRQAAVDAFDKAIAADPNKADAYYWKSTNLIGAATLQGDKMVAPPGTAEGFQKYLELQPTGPHAEEAKAMLASLGAPVETSFGTKKPKPTKK